LNRIAAIVVTHNSAGHISACLDSLAGRAETIVVDNASNDGSADLAKGRPGVRVIASATNLGFAAGVNLGARATGAPLLLLLNPDAAVECGLDELAGICEARGLAAGKLVGPDGRVQTGFAIRRLPSLGSLAFEVLGLNRLWPANPVNRRYRCLDRALDEEGDAEQPAGAFWMIRRDVFDAVGGFDESFHPVWFEDVDFAKRAAGRGFRTYYYPAAIARHQGGHSVTGLPGQCRTQFWYASLLRYAAKHFGNLQFRVLSAAVAAGCLLRSVAGIFGESREALALVRMARLASRSLLTGKLCAVEIGAEKWKEPGEAARPVSVR
jgi:GT2 family glycosyltransferase